MSKDKVFQKVTFGSFVEELEAQNIARADLYKYGDIDFTYETKDGQVFGTELPYVAAEDDLLISVLKQNSVEYIAHTESHPYKESGHHMGKYVSYLIFITPLLLIGLLFYQARVISRLGSELAALKTRPPELS
ncbi:hypothetical protein [Rubritalea sp.]|uniref:hypothetical protein n=1 Tax=Rubritalea sp. TaxID=2109375 RepID=UPI003EF11AB7